MKNSMNNFLISENPQSSEQQTTTLVIDEVPSEVACEVLLNSLSKGRVASREEVMARISHEDVIHIPSSEFFETIKSLINLREENIVDQFNRYNYCEISSTNEELIQALHDTSGLGGEENNHEDEHNPSFRL